MCALLDVNVLVALLDADHASQGNAVAWFADHAKAGWASCPITENGCVRIMSHPGYPNAHTVAEVVERLRLATTHAAQEFWANDLSLLDADALDPSRIHGSRQLFDAYLLALAVRHGGRLVTFDKAILLAAVPRAGARNLVTL